MADIPEANKTPKPSGFLFRRRALYAVCSTLASLAIAFLFAPWLFRLLADEGFSRWIGVPIFLVLQIASYLLLEAMLLRPVQRNPAKLSDETSFLT
jgi:O-antigen/teichoic acid export membrane protein